MDPCPVLVGRQQELAALRAILDAGGGVAIVSGEAGIGKSRLVREFAKEAEKQGRIVLWARPEEVAQPGPYALIVDLLESIAERGGSAVKTEARSLVSELRRTGTEGQRPAPAPRSVAAEVRGLVAQLGKPPLIVMEDLHWADESSHSVVLHLARAAGDDEHIVVGILRSERGKAGVSIDRLMDSLLRERTAYEVALRPMVSTEMARMLELMWGRPPSDYELAEIVRLGEGVPFFVEELANPQSGGERVRVPRSVEQSVSARVRDLGDEAARLLITASLVSGPLDVSVLALACDLPEDRVADHLTAAAGAGLLADLDSRLTFRHSLVREALAANLVSVEAAQTHGRLAAAIEKVHAGELEPFAGALANHYSEAGEKLLAVEYANRAGERALAFAATEEARSFFSMALKIDRSALGALRGLAEVEFRDANEVEAARLFRDVADRFREQGRYSDAAQVLGRLSWALQGQVPPARVLGVLDEALELLTAENPNESARLMVQKGSIQCFLLNQTVEARPTLSKALDIAERAGDLPLIAEALDSLAQADELEGNLPRALSLGLKSVDAAKRSGSTEVIGRTHNNYALKLAISGRPHEGLSILSAGREHLKRTHGRAALGALDVSEAWVSWLMGLPTEVARLTARGRVSWQRWRGYRWLLETWCAIELGDGSRAEAAVDEAWSALGGPQERERLFAETTNWTRDTGAAVHASVLLSLSLGQSNEAAEAAEILVAYARHGVEKFDFGQILVLSARCSRAAGDSSSAIRTLDELDQLLTKYEYPYLEANAREIRALLALQAGEPGLASDQLLLAMNLLEESRNVGDLARCERLLAEALIKEASQGQPGIRDHLKSARALAERAGALVELNRVEALARTLGMRLRSGRSKGSVKDGHQLSPRELEVAALVAEGETNARIAARLFLSDRTVQDHISHALRKLNLSSRAALASWAARNGLL